MHILNIYIYIYIHIANDMLKNSVYNLKVALIYHIHSAHDEKPFGVHHLPTSPPKRQGTTKNVLFPTCQVIVSRFYQRCCPPPPPPASSSTSSASDSASVPTLQILLGTADLNRERQISVGTDGPVPALSGHSDIP